MKLVYLLAIPVLLAAAESKQVEDKPPVIPPELQAEYFRADGTLAHLKPVGWDEAQADLMKAVVEIQKACGEKFSATMIDKRLVCVAKPELPKESAKK